MNRSRKWVLGVGLAVFFLVGFFYVPYAKSSGTTGRQISTTFAPLLSPPILHGGIDLAHYLAQQGFIAAVTGGLVLVLKDKGKG